MPAQPFCPMDIPKLAAKFAVASSTPSAFDCVSMFMGKAPALVRDTNAKDSTGNAFFRYVTGFTRFAARIIRCTMNIAMIATYEKIMNLPRSTIAAKSLVAMTFAMSAMTPEGVSPMIIFTMHITMP